MSSGHGHLGSVSYDPLPLTQDDLPSDILYNFPPTPDPRLSVYHTPQSFSRELDPGVPLGTAQPRFLGAALYDDPSAPGIRESYASSQHTLPGGHGSEYTGSLYALNAGAEGTPGENYHDDPTPRFVGDDHVPMSAVGQAKLLEGKRSVYAAPRNSSRRKMMIVAIIGALLLIILAVIIAVYFAVIHHSNKNEATNSTLSSTATSSSSKAAPSSKPAAAIVTGGDGSKVTTDDGSTFVYRNSFGGSWYWDQNDPFNNGAQSQSWNPALNSTFKYGNDQIRGVNLGGWLVTEPFMQVFSPYSPALYEPYVNNTTPAIDEWTLCENMAADTANGGISQLETHYKTFITEQDFADIAGAGLNFVRIPLGYWAIETGPNEPFLPKTSWTYFLKAIKWARKYGIRINLDLHALPGSQNGWNHSGRLGTVGVLNGPMGYANAQRSLNIIRVIAEFISQQQYSDVVPIFGIMNEPQGSIMGQGQLSSFYFEAYQAVRTAGGTGQGNGPYVSMHDGFFSRTSWVDVFPNADRITLDTHPYLCFNEQSPAPMSSYATTPCSTWGSGVNASMGTFGLTAAGEFSNAVTDCGLYLNGVGLGTRYEGDYPGVTTKTGSCTTWTDWQNYSAGTKQDIMNFALASMDALQNYFFWTWKIGNSSVTGTIETPAWSYQLGLQNGWMPTDPRSAIGYCGNSSPWQPPLMAWQTGGTGAGNIPATATSALAWPPATISQGGAITALPSYAPIGPIPTLSAPTFTLTGATHFTTSTVNVGDGWANPSDTTGAYVAIATCSYLDPWVDPSTSPPSPLCS